MATQRHLVFARPLDASGATLVLVGRHRLASIGPVTRFLRHHPRLQALDQASQASI